MYVGGLFCKTILCDPECMWVIAYVGGRVVLSVLGKRCMKVRYSGEVLNLEEPIAPQCSPQHTFSTLSTKTQTYAPNKYTRPQS